MWSGSEALKLGLVDELGGLTDATKHAAQRARLGDDFKVVEFPQKRPLAEAISAAMEGHRREEAFAGPLGALLRDATEELRTLARLNDPSGLYALLPFELRLR